MKNSVVLTLLLALAALGFTASPVEAKTKPAIVGDIILLGNVERSGQKLFTDASVFEGDSIRTDKGSAGVLRVSDGRLELGESSEIKVLQQNPLKIALKTGTLAINFPKATPLEIVTPQLEVHPDAGSENFSAVINAVPEMEDRFQSRTGDFTVIERQKNGKSSHILPGQIVVAALLPTIALSTAALEPIPAPQGPIVGPQIATLTQASGDVRVARSNAPNNFARVQQGLGLGTNDYVRTLNGRASVQFPAPDNSVITLTEGTTIQVQQMMQAAGVSRRITQYIGNIWFNITRATGTQTTLQTPTAVAAIRGTQGTQDVPNDTQSTHSLNEGLESITELVTNQSVTIRSGQQVTAIKGIGFGPVLALVAAIAQPVVGAGGGAANAGQNQPGGNAATSTVATTSTVTTVAAVTATAVAATTGVLVAVVPVAARKTPPADNTTPTPLNPPGGG